MSRLESRTIGFLVANEGIEQIELTEPWNRVKEEGGQPILVAPEPGTVQAFNHLDAADTFEVDQTTASISIDDFDGVVLPGGVANPDQLRMDEPAVAFLREFVAAGKPVAVICHGPWTLVEAGVLDGRTLTSWPSLQTDIRNAGGTWVDSAVEVDGNLVSSRKPDDLPQFLDAMVDAFESVAVA
jgi:protease I